MIITKIEQQKKNNSRYSVFIDGAFAFGLNGTDVLYYKLKEGLVLDEKRYGEIMDGVVYEEAKHKALKLLSYAPRTESEIRKKLMEKDYPEEIAGRVVAMLKSYDYINDYKYAEKYIDYHLNSKGYGQRRILFDLRQKGIDERDINELFEKAVYDISGIITALIEKKLKKSGEISEKQLQKVYNYLAGRGFYSEDIASCLKTYRRSQNEF